jgi:hypothetical protein
MAKLVTLCTTLTHLGFTAGAALAITDDKGLDSFDEIKLLMDE